VFIGICQQVMFTGMCEYTDSYICLAYGQYCLHNGLV